MAKTQTNVAWAAEFGGSCIRRVRLERAGATYRAAGFEEVPLDNRWADSADLVAAMRKFSAVSADQPVVHVVCDEFVLFRTLQLPRADRQALDKMVRRQLEVLIPSQADRFASAWHAAGGPKDEPQQRVLLCAARRQTLATMGQAGRHMAARHGRRTVPSMFALAACWGQLAGAASAEPVVLLDVGARSTSLGLFEAGSLRKAVVVDYGGDHWTERIAEKLKINPAAAEQKKLSYFADPSSGEEVGQVLAEALAEWMQLVREGYEDLVDGIARPSRPKRCILFGRASRTPGLTTQIANALGVEAAIPTFNKALAGPEGAQVDAAAACIGAAVFALEGGMEDFDLTADKTGASAGSHTISWKRAALWAAMIVWVLGGLVLLQASSDPDTEGMAKIVSEVSREAKRQGGLGRQLAIGKYLESGAPGPIETLDRISKAAAKSALLSSLQYNRSGDVTIGGTVSNQKEFFAMLKDLAEVGQVEWKSGRPDKNKFRFDVRLTIARGRKMPASQPADKAKADQSKEKAPAKRKPADKGSADSKPAAPAPAEKPSPTSQPAATQVEAKGGAA